MISTTRFVFVFAMPLLAAAWTCHWTCKSDNCRGTGTNPIPDGEQWHEDPNASDSGCCAMWMGGCHRCCDGPVYNGVCENGTAPAEADRTEDDECSSCDLGYLLLNKRCVSDQCTEIQYDNFELVNADTSPVPDRASDVSLATVANACDSTVPTSPLIRLSSSMGTQNSNSVTISESTSNMAGVTVGGSVKHTMGAGFGPIQTKDEVTVSLDVAYQHTWSDETSTSSTDTTSSEVGFFVQNTVHLTPHSIAAFRTTLESYTYSAPFTVEATCFNAAGNRLASATTAGVFEGSFYVGNGEIVTESLQCPDRGCSDKPRPDCTGDDASCRWFDAGGADYDCTWYSQKGDRCSKYGNQFENVGMTANNACCTCGGGNRLTFDGRTATIAGLANVIAGLPSDGLHLEVYEVHEEVNRA